MPATLLALMIQSAFRVVFERESLRLAFLLGVVPSPGRLYRGGAGDHGYAPLPPRMPGR